MLSKLQSILSKLAVPQAEIDSSPGHLYSIARHQALSTENSSPRLHLFRSPLLMRLRGAW